MMKVYEVKVETVTAEGRHEGWERIALTVNKKRAREIAQGWVEEHETGWWRMCYGTNREEHINVVVEELGEITE